MPTILVDKKLTKEIRKNAEECISQIIKNGPRIDSKTGITHTVEELILLAVLNDFCSDLVQIY